MFGYRLRGRQTSTESYIPVTAHAKIPRLSYLLSYNTPSDPCLFHFLH